MLKDKLLATGMIEDNEYLDRYVALVESNSSTCCKRGITQSHHIIPVCIFQSLGLPVDNSASNKVHLLYKDHILAHCLLTLCSGTLKFKADMFAAVLFLMGATSLTTAQLKEIVEYEDFDVYQKAYEAGRLAAYEFNPMFDAAKKEQHDDVMRSEDVRNRISTTIRDRIKEGVIFDEEHRKKLSDNAYNSVFIHKWDVVKRIPREELEAYEREGWILNGGTGGACSGFKKLKTPEGRVTYVPPECVEEYLSKGYSLDLPRGWKNVRHMNREELHEKLSKAHKKQ